MDQPVLGLLFPITYARMRVNIYKKAKYFLFMYGIKPIRLCWFKFKNYQTYILKDTAEGKVITCLICKMRSFNPVDVRERYCVHCDLFHEFLSKSKHSKGPVNPLS